MITVFGMIHFSPLEGDPHFSNKDLVLERAKADLEVLLLGGVDGIIFENNFDNPKFAFLPAKQSAHFEELVRTLVPSLSVPWGVSPLWNDYPLGFRLCQELGGVLVRVPVFVDSVETVYGTFEAEPERVMQVRKDLGAEQVQVIADVQVKHARMLHPRLLSESVKEAVIKGADGVIITGSWTGDPPTVAMVQEARDAEPQTKIYIGSGMTPENIQSFLPFIDACIVGSAFKEQSVQKQDGPNIVGEDVRYDLDRVKRFMEAVRTN